MGKTHIHPAVWILKGVVVNVVVGNDEDPGYLRYLEQVKADYGLDAVVPLRDYAGDDRDHPAVNAPGRPGPGYTTADGGKTFKEPATPAEGIANIVAARRKD